MGSPRQGHFFPPWVASSVWVRGIPPVHTKADISTAMGSEIHYGLLGTWEV